MIFTRRNTDAELMDDPLLEDHILCEVLKDIEAANRFLGGNKITIQGVWQLVEENPQAEYTLVDMGCGNGAMLREIISIGKKKQLKLKAIGIDLSANAIQIAKTASIDFPEISYLQRDILGLSPKELSCDILLCTLTMHHFGNEQIPFFLDKFVALAHLGVIINDLQRSKVAYHLFKGFSVLFVHTSVAKNDGLISIKSGFSKPELIGFSKQITNVRHTIQWKWAFRYVWIMRKKRLI
jgi:2-polyprenyl-3-methyl-5-hydroxy-6-metoxy-1,4-benzoquinol methylase